MAVLPDLIATQHRLIYTLLKPVVRAASRFEVSVSILSDLLRLAYFEHLFREEGLSTAEIATRFGQSERHMRSLGKRLKGDFFGAEQEVGLVRDVEAEVALKSPSRADLAKGFASWSADELSVALDRLLREDRIVKDASGNYRTAQRYVVLRSETFEHRIDALNHFLTGAYRAVLHRLVFDRKRGAMIKTLTFAAKESSLNAYIERLEGDLRRELATLDEEASFEGEGKRQFTLGIALAPANEDFIPREGE